MSNPAEREPVAPAAPSRVIPLPKELRPLEMALRVAFAVAQEGALRWFALISSCALFAWTIWEPSLLRWGIASTYCALIYVFPGLRRTKEDE